MPADKDPLSDEVIIANYASEPTLQRLRRAGYMSPQSKAFTGEGFACANCDWLGGTMHDISRQRGADMAWCNQPTIRTPIEKKGCCNFFKYRGVHT